MDTDAFRWGASAFCGALAVLGGLACAYFVVAFIWTMFFSREAKESRAQWAHWHKNQAALAARRAAKGLGPPRDGFYYCDACDALREQGTGPRRRCPVCRAE